MGYRLYKIESNIRKIFRNKRQVMKLKRNATRIGFVALSMAGIISFKNFEASKVKAVKSEVEDNGFLLDSYGTIADKDIKLSKTEKKVFSETDFTFIPVSDNSVSEDLIASSKADGKNIGLIVKPTDYTYAALYQTIDKVKEIVRKYEINCPILYDISKYMDADNIRANCLLAEEFCNKLSANGCYVGLAGSKEDFEKFTGKFVQFTETHSIDLYDKMVCLDEDCDLEELAESFDGNYNIVMTKEGIVLWKYNLSQVIKEQNLNSSDKFVSEYVYTVESGDCLSKIAAEYNMKTEDLANYNGISSDDEIYPGDGIVIPNNYTHLDKETRDSIKEDITDIEHEIIKREYSEEKIENKNNIRSESLNSILKGIDVSKHQGNVDWDLVKEDVDFAILRLCDFYYATNDENCALDKKFLSNMQACEEKNIPVGVYYFSRATNDEEAIKEAKFVAEKLKAYSLEFPVYMDVETDYLNNLITKNPDEFKTIAKAAMKTLEENGYFAGIYCNKGVFKNIEDLSREYTFWLTSNKTYNQDVNFERFKEDSFPVLYIPNNNISIYQYSQRGKVSGIESFVDIDYAYSFLPEIIDKNGFSKVKKR